MALKEELFKRDCLPGSESLARLVLTDLAFFVFATCESGQFMYLCNSTGSIRCLCSYVVARYPT